MFLWLLLPQEPQQKKAKILKIRSRIQKKIMAGNLKIAGFYRWFKEFEGALTELPAEGPRYRSRRPAAAGGPYLIQGVRNEDAGYYICRLNNSVSQMDVRIRLNVFGKRFF